MKGNDMKSDIRTTAARRDPMDSLRKTALVAGVLMILTGPILLWIAWRGWKLAMKKSELAVNENGGEIAR